MGNHGLAVWLGFTGIVIALLVLDLGVLNRRSHVLTFKEAMSWSSGLIAFALLFGLFRYFQVSYGVVPPRGSIVAAQADANYIRRSDAELLWKAP